MSEANPPENLGGGRGGPLPLRRSELQTLERHIRKNPRFYLSEIGRKQVPEEMELIATCGLDMRTRIMAARVLVAMDALNVAQEREEEKREDERQAAAAQNDAAANRPPHQVLTDEQLTAASRRLVALVGHRNGSTARNGHANGDGPLPDRPGPDPE
jgi:hypothetical protein